ncbi:MAG: ABC transporter substrate-binding protein [Lachnospiraceae bacterium]|nr:ABC transporter substrate-binding protein [Lachnospiraceae bacterium]
MKHFKFNKYTDIAAMILLLVILLFMILGGCSLFQNIEDESVNEHDENLIVVGVSQLGSESGWRTANTESVQASFTKKNGYFLLFNNARQKQENQFKTIRSFISRRVDYIVFAPVVETGWETVLSEAKEAGIPVILMDRSVTIEDKSLYTALVGSNFVEEGEKAGRWLEKDLEEKGRSEKDINIVILKGTQGASAQVGRTVGFSTIASEHSNWNILDQEYADFTSAKGKEVMESFLKKYPDIDVVISQNDDMTFGALEAIKESGRTVGIDGEITIISFDAVMEALEMVAEGTINVDIECNPDQGKYISEVIRMLEAGEEIEKEYYVEEDVFTIDNVTEELLNKRTY